MEGPLITMKFLGNAVPEAVKCSSVSRGSKTNKILYLALRDPQKSGSHLREAPVGTKGQDKELQRESSTTPNYPLGNYLGNSLLSASCGGRLEQTIKANLK